MAEPTTKAEALAELAGLQRSTVCASCLEAGDRECCDHLCVIFDAIAAWLRAACVVEGGHHEVDPWTGKALDHCFDCGQRRAAEPDGGR